MNILQKLLHLGVPSPRRSHLPLKTPEEWQTYWAVQGHPWRKEPEINLQRQAELAQKRSIIPDVKQGVYPFKGVKLSRADVEWLLTTHENGRGPMDWGEESQRRRKGLDLRGADLRRVDLRGLPLSRMCGGLPVQEWNGASAEQREMAAVLLGGSDLTRTQLSGANLRGAQLQGATLYRAQLQGADLRGAQLQGANLTGAQMQGVDLLGAQLQGANLIGAQMQGVDLRHIVLGNQQRIGPRVADVKWGDTNFAVVNWSQVRMLGDEYEALQKRNREGKKVDKGTRLEEYQRAVRATRQLAVALQTQGLNEQAARFAYRAQVLQRRVFWFEVIQDPVELRQRGRALAAWLFSWFLFLLAGYGYKPWRSFLAYVLINVGFTVLYLGLDGHLAWYEAVVVSMTAFHGRGFSPSTFSPGDPLSIASAFEAFVGLIIEVTFIATLTQRFFNR